MLIMRLVFVKYTDRGLANDRYYYNMNMTLFKRLFWTTNLSLFLLNQGVVWSYAIKHGRSFAENSHRFLYSQVFQQFWKD